MNFLDHSLCLHDFLVAVFDVTLRALELSTSLRETAPGFTALLAADSAADLLRSSQPSQEHLERFTAALCTVATGFGALFTHDADGAHQTGYGLAGIQVLAYGLDFVALVHEKVVRIVSVG